MSFAAISFGEQIIKKTLDVCSSESRYQFLRETYYKHESYFNDKYTETDFGCISAFQDRISERENDYHSGGTGLTRLLKSLEEMSDATDCYMLTGWKRLNFIKELLEYDENGWIGFNKDHRIDYPPDPRLITKSPFCIPGIAYNLNFVCKIDRRDQNES